MRAGRRSCGRAVGRAGGRRSEPVRGRAGGWAYGRDDERASRRAADGRSSRRMDVRADGRAYGLTSGRACVGMADVYCRPAGSHSLKVPYYIVFQLY